MTIQKENILPFTDRHQFRQWLSENHDTAKECWLILKRGRPADNEHFWYIDAVEEALCFGWIDSTVTYLDGTALQRFSRRRKGSGWTELNKERVRRLERLGMMTDAGRAVLPPMDGYIMDPDIWKALNDAGAWDGFAGLPPLYQRIRVSNLVSRLGRGDTEGYRKGLEHLIETAREGKTFGEWDDYGRLSE